MKISAGIKRISAIMVVIVLMGVLMVGCRLEDSASDYRHFEGEISLENLEKTLRFLTSEELDGRMTGSDGNQAAMEFVVKQMESSGLKANKMIGDFTQEYSQLINTQQEEMVLEIIDPDGTVVTKFIPYEHYREAMFRSEVDNNKEDTQMLVLITDLAQLREEKVEDKVIVIHSSLLESSDVNELISRADQAKVSGVIFNRDNKYNDTFYVKSASIDQYIYESGFDEENGIASFYIDDQTMSVIETAIANKQLIHYKANFEMRSVETANVIGEIKGSPGEETILIGAHLDHVGGTERFYCPGALDNASGIATMLEVSRILGESGAVPVKNIVFMAFNGEETGLRGSRYYVNQPVYELSKTQMINLDMVGSKRDVPLSIEKTGYHTDELDDELIEIAKENNLSYDIGENGRSDHINFGERGAEAVMLINYDLTRIHTPEDTIEANIDLEYMTRIVDLLLQYIDENAF